MITLHKHKDNVQLCFLKDGKKKIPVYWHPIRKKEMRLAVTDIKGFFNEELRDRYKLSELQAERFAKHLSEGTSPEAGMHQAKFFGVKKHVDDSLYSQMDLLNSPQTLELPFPPGSRTWPELALVVGASSSGKTHFCIDKVISNLKGPEKDKRHFLVVSNEWNRDKTLTHLKKEQFRRNVRGIDISEETLETSPYSTGNEYFEKIVKPACLNCEEGDCIIFDDNMDSCCAKEMRLLINKLLRTARHSSVGIMFILHSIKSGVWSAQSSNSMKYFVLFPRSQRGKCREFLRTELGTTLGEARNHIADFAQRSRAMIVRLFSPQCLISKNMIRLL